MPAILPPSTDCSVTPKKMNGKSFFDRSKIEKNAEKSREKRHRKDFFFPFARMLLKGMRCDGSIRGKKRAASKQSI